MLQIELELLDKWTLLKMRWTNSITNEEIDSRRVSLGIRGENENEKFELENVRTLGRVTQLYPGSDGIPRVATLRTGKGDIRKAISNLCPLPPLHEAVLAEAVLKDLSFKVEGMSNSTPKSAPMIALSIWPKGQH
ncbi:hypothetical protein JTB14_001926 [Gonioctena quinquepunctata]|nr:hypothetical protein JTB14_001926 [Gonioctena quinquepunctata]